MNTITDIRLTDIERAALKHAADLESMERLVADLLAHRLEIRDAEWRQLLRPDEVG